MSDRWYLPLIQGFCGSSSQLSFLSRPFRLTLIARRRSANAGTRLLARGIDEGGNVANHVETEVIASFDRG